MEPEHGLLGWFFQYLWAPILAIGAYLFHGYRKEVNDLTAGQAQLRTDLEAHKLFAAETYVRQAAIVRLETALNRVEDKIDGLKNLMIEKGNG